MAEGIATEVSVAKWTNRRCSGIMVKAVSTSWLRRC
jgi:hypothetical protein